MTNTVKYENFKIPKEIYERMLDNIIVKPGGHWVWQGAKSGQRKIPQVSMTVDLFGEKQSMTLNVARLVFVVEKNVTPYQVRRDKALCKNPLCVAPDHHYLIMNRPEVRAKGGRCRNFSRVPGKSLPDARTG